tara:strand:+ start:769 stop:1221 length:453 start_codon:yes stop_codon:yes gene_type:complete
MATRNIVPRTGSQGQIGTTTKKWLKHIAVTGSFGRMNAETVEAKRFIVSSSVTNITTQELSGSTRFGDSLDDTHQFTGSMSISGSLKISGQTIIDSMDTASNSLIVSGAMQVVDQKVSNKIASASIFVKGLGTIASTDQAGVIDCGDGFN